MKVLKGHLLTWYFLYNKHGTLPRDPDCDFRIWIGAVTKSALTLPRSRLATRFTHMERGTNILEELQPAPSPY